MLPLRTRHDERTCQQSGGDIAAQPLDAALGPAQTMAMSAFESGVVSPGRRHGDQGQGANGGHPEAGPRAHVDRQVVMWAGLAGGFHDRLLFLSRSRPVSDVASYPTDAAVRTQNEG